MARVIVRTVHRRQSIVAALCLAIAMALVCWFYLSKSHPSEKEVTAAEDEVYEAVVHDMLTEAHGQLSQLVFDDAVLTEAGTEADKKSCKENLRKRLRLEGNPPLYNSLADKAYRVVTRGWYDDSLPADAVQDFVEKSCTAGRLSHTFRTDLPRTFLSAESTHFTWPEFEQKFPRADGIVSFSRVGFDSHLRRAIVSSSFVCGGLCGGGSRYVLKKKWGRWEVVNKWTVWVS